MVDRRFLPFLSLLCLGVLCLAGCAKTGDPHPPHVLIPRAATDLEARQYANRILLTASPPVTNTNGSRVTTLGRVAIFRIAGNRPKDAAPLPEKEFLAQAKPVRSVSAADLSNYLRDGKLAFWDDPGSVNPAAIYALDLCYAISFINRKNQSAGLSNQVCFVPVPIPTAPEGLSFTLFADRIHLRWNPPTQNLDGSTPARIAGYNIFRSEKPEILPTAPLNAEPAPNSEFDDRNFEFDRTYYYAVSVIGSRTRPVAESLPSALHAIAVKDTFPPGMPQALAAVAEKGVVTLLWAPPDDNDLAGYRVYRKKEGTGERILLHADLVTALSFRDDQVRTGDKCEYSVVAVDTHGNVSQAATKIVEVP